MIAGLIHAAAGGDPPAGGAAVGQVVGVTLAALVLTAALLVFGLGHRSGRVKVLGRLAAFAARHPWLRGLPGWAALPLAICLGALLTAVLGMYWDISLHIDDGRDPGPLANPAHYLILAGLFGLFAAGWLALVLPEGRPGRAAVRLAPGWHVPVSGILLMACASFALLGFPLDDVWHRLFGQDVTLWGPTHLMLIGGAGLSLVGVLALITEGRAAMAVERRPERPRRVSRMVSIGRRAQVVMACGGLLLAMSVFQGEWDFGVAQFRLLFQPVLIVFATALGLVAARIVGGRGTALGAALFFLLVRGALALIVGGVFGETTPHMPLYVVEALAVEALAFAVSPRRYYMFGALAGLLVGTVGVVSEWGWTHVWMPVPWPAHMLGAALALSVPVGVASGLLGGFVGAGLRLRPEAATRRALAIAAASLVVIAVPVGYLLHTTVPRDARAAVTLTGARSTGSEREAQLTVRFTPAAVARGADWLEALSWQGGDRLVLRPLSRVSDGVYRTTTPVPVSGDWKTMIRLQRGSVLASVPVYLPADSAIPLPEVPAAARFTRSFSGDHALLQRERKRGVAGWIWTAASLVVLALFLLILAVIGWGLARLAGRGTRPGPPDAVPAPRVSRRDTPAVPAKVG